MFITNYNNNNDDDDKVVEKKEEKKRKSIFSLFKKEEKKEEEPEEDSNFYEYYDELEAKEQEEKRLKEEKIEQERLRQEEIKLKQEEQKKEMEKKRKETPSYHAVSNNTSEYELDKEKMKIYAQAEDVRRKYTKEDVKTYEEDADPFLQPQKGYKIIGVLFLVGLIAVMVKMLGASTQTASLSVQFNEVGVQVKKSIQLNYFTNDISNTYFKTENTNICEVNETTGYVTGLREGTCTVTVTNDSDKLSKEIKVYVTPTKEDLIDFTIDNELTISRGDEIALNITLVPASTSNPTFTFTSTNEKIATISTRGIIKGMGKGTTTIIVTNNDIERRINVIVK